MLKARRSATGIWEDGGYGGGRAGLQCGGNRPDGPTAGRTDGSSQIRRRPPIFLSLPVVELRDG
jgi:hypothetical protein